MSREEEQESAEAAKFAEVLKNERDTIAAQRAPAKNTNGDMQLAGLAFSGGGIRSAVFNLGFIQGLANRNSLHVFDYLSTVSGGGYIGGWLSALLKRHSDMPAGEADMNRLQNTVLKTPLPDAKPDATGFPEVEDKAVRFVRRYSDYLTPRLGLSGDTLALISLGVRNFVVIQLLLVSMLVTVFAGLLLMRQIGNDTIKTVPHLWGVAVVIVILLVGALYAALRLQKKLGEAEDNDGNPSRSVALKVLVPALFSGVLAAILLSKIAPTSGDVWGAVGAVAVGLIYALAWWWRAPPHDAKSRAGILGGAVTLGVLFYVLLSHAAIEHALTYAPPVAMALFSLVMTVHLALAGASVSELNREWWGRLGGQGMLLALGWTLPFLFMLYAPPLLQYGWGKAEHWLIAGGGLWTALTWIGTKLAQSQDTGASNSNRANEAKEFLARLAPWVFIVGMLGLVAWMFVKCLPGIELYGDTLEAMTDHYQDQLNHLKFVVLLGIALVSGLLFRLLLKYVDLNLFSAHSFYTGRLARTFMGASQKERKPNPYTGFDPEDDLPLSELAGQRPIHLVNATLNLTGGEDLAWQTRRGACFTFTPSYSGYSTRDSNGREFGGYRRTTEYGGGLSLATTVATSGAAASPNMGFHTSASVAALLTIFNLRLARWCPNPNKDQWRRRAPKSSAAPLFSDLLGSTNGENTWINLSDGGHFENLGIYELIRRRAALILVTDVGADGKYQFDDLAMAVRKIWVDFGVRVEIAETDLDEIRPKATKAAKDAPRFSNKHWAIGRICYPDGKPGYLIYVKSTIAADAPVDIRQYYDAHPAFPHEATADQWFDEDQFEAYRHLGQIIAEKLLDKLPVKDGARLSASEIIGKLYLAASDYFANKPPCPDTQPIATQGGQP